MIRWSSWQSNGTNCTCQNLKQNSQVHDFHPSFPVHEPNVVKPWKRFASFVSRTFGWNDYSLRVGKHDDSRALICVYGRNTNKPVFKRHVFTNIMSYPACESKKKSWTGIVRYIAICCWEMIAHTHCVYSIMRHVRLAAGCSETTISVRPGSEIAVVSSPFLKHLQRF